MGAAGPNRRWVAQAIDALHADHRLEDQTPLLKLDLPEFPGIDLYIKDESTHPSGSLKHRLARSLFLHAICNGEISEGTTVVEASSGSTAISEGYFARLLGLPLIAVVPAGTAPGKLDAIKRSGTKIHLVEAHQNTCAVAENLALEIGGHYMDQFMYAERATDWRGNNNIAESLFDQLSGERHPKPHWIVVGAGTGGTSATIGRYIRYRPDLASAQLMVVDPVGSAFFPYFCAGDRRVTGTLGGIVEGIGRASVEPSFMRNVIDEMMSVPDAASIAGAYWLEPRLQRRFGPSTGTNIVGALSLAAQMHAQGLAGSIATLACDSGERYADTIYDPAWLKSRAIDIALWQENFAQLHVCSKPFGADLQRAHSHSSDR
jgi:cysteine synthase